MSGVQREERIARVVAAWGAVKSADKPALMEAHPDLYWAVAWLAASEAARREVRAAFDFRGRPYRAAEGAEDGAR